MIINIILCLPFIVFSMLGLISFTDVPTVWWCWCCESDVTFWWLFPCWLVTEPFSKLELEDWLLPPAAPLFVLPVELPLLPLLLLLAELLPLLLLLLPLDPFWPLLELLFEVELWPDDFCWLRRSCLRNFARRFWNQT